MVKIMPHIVKNIPNCLDIILPPCTTSYTPNIKATKNIAPKKIATKDGNTRFSNFVSNRTRFSSLTPTPFTMISDNVLTILSSSLPNTYCRLAFDNLLPLLHLFSPSRMRALSLTLQRPTLFEAEMILKDSISSTYMLVTILISIRLFTLFCTKAMK